MADDSVPIDGSLVEDADLEFPRARLMIRAIRTPGSLATLVECRKSDAIETVIFDVNVERPQVPVNDIRGAERIAVQFTEPDDQIPEVLALRDSFPWVPHLNQRHADKPRSLCLYDRPWLELKPAWTAASFIERIRWWLTQTARAELHGAQQPLEPLMLSHGYDLIIPSDLGRPRGRSTLQARVVLVEGKEGRVIVSDDPDGPSRGGMPSLVMFVDTPAKAHGVIRRTPLNLKELAVMVDGAGFTLMDQLRAVLQEIPDEVRTNRDRRRELRPIFVLGLPKTRTPGGAVELVELKGFLCLQSVEEVGTSLGAWVVHEGELGRPLVIDGSIDGSDIRVTVLNVIRDLTWDAAAAQSGFGLRDPRRIVAIGAGALGSQVAMNLARGGVGTWTLIDDDPFMPHNSVRHALGGRYVVGHNKALGTAFSMNLLAEDKPIAKAIPGNLLKPGDHRSQIDEALGQAELLLDMSASVPVSRALADADLPCRATAMFLSPEGTDLVLLVEDTERKVKLDDLEMLYYAEVATRTELAGHLSSSKAPTRYGAGCRDVSVVMPQTNVGTLAGVGAGGLLRHLSADSAAAWVWRLDVGSMSIAAVDLPVSQFASQEQNGWRVSISPSVLESISEARSSRLPNETGGILIGGVDHDRRCVHIVLALPSPPDSGEWPNMYIRGISGLNEAREGVVSATAGNLNYLGEWHSHPDQHSTLPSNDDRQVFRWIRDLVDIDERPAVMIIAGDDGARVFVSEIDMDTAEVRYPTSPSAPVRGERAEAGG